MEKIWDKMNQLHIVVLMLSWVLAAFVVMIGVAIDPHSPALMLSVLYLALGMGTMGTYGFWILYLEQRDGEAPWEKLLTSWYGGFAFVWSLPISLPVFLFYLFPAWAFRQHKWAGRWGWVLEWEVVPGSWLERTFWKKWAGHAAGCFTVFKFPYHAITEKRKHERRHVWQHFVFGIFAPIVWFIHWIYLVASGKNAYKDHVNEIDARIASGQQRRK